MISRRTTGVALLAGAAVLLPCAAWYVAGSRSTEERAVGLRRAPVDQGRGEARRIADRIALRLEALRQSESGRPFSAYGSGIDSLEEACEVESAPGIMQTEEDPLVWTRLQIDDVGRLTVPTMGREPEAAAAEMRQAIIDELNCAASHDLAARLQSDPGRDTRRVQSSGGLVTVGPFSWHTLVLRGRPALVAIREVTTRQAVVIHGFVALPSVIEARMAPSHFPARLLPGAPDMDTDSRVALDGDPWIVRVDTSEAVVAATAAGRQLKAAFLRTFAIGTAAALIAAAVIVLLVHKSERTAAQRAEFAAAAAHELRTPLAGLQLYGEMLAQGTGNPANRRDYAQRVADEASRLGRVVTNVLGLARLEKGSAVVSPVPGDLGATVRESLERLRPTLESRGVGIHLHIDNDLGPAVFDRDAVHQILQNLLDNAEKYTRDSPNRNVDVALASGPGGVTLSVADHGPGIPSAQRHVVFRPFRRLRDRGGPEGLGIGLTLVQALSRAQGAVASQRSVDGGGADFRVVFQPSATLSAS